MKSKFYHLKEDVIKLRKIGKTYGEIIKITNHNIPKSTLSEWCKKINLNNFYKEKINQKIIKNCRKGVEAARIINKKRRDRYLQSIKKRNEHLSKILKNNDVAKVVLSVLYLGEGTKGIKRGSLRFGNSDPFIIDLFLNLLKKCYIIDKKKFRCTVLCRADQNHQKLENFWSKVTEIPLSQFYKTRVDSRTIGKPTKKKDYRGVCVIDYFSADIFLDLMEIPKTIHQMGL